MNFNPIINKLKLRCREKAEMYQSKYSNHGGIAYIGCSAANELEFKLSVLMDKPFENTEDFQECIKQLMDVHYEPCIVTPVNSVAARIIEKINNEMLEYLTALLSGKEQFFEDDLPYCRVIVDEEARELIGKFKAAWGYVNTDYWFPLNGNDPEEIPDKFFIMFEYFKPHINEISALIGIPEKHIYEYGESAFRPDHCLETVELQAYGGCETVYADKDFTWFIYYSHEDTVAFAGTIVPIIKELLKNEEEHFNCFEWS